MERITGREGPLAAGAVGLALVALATTQVHTPGRGTASGPPARAAHAAASAPAAAASHRATAAKPSARSKTHRHHATKKRTAAHPHSAHVARAATIRSHATAGPAAPIVRHRARVRARHPAPTVRRRWAPRRRAARRLSAPARVHAVRRAVRVGGHSAEASAAGIVFTLSAPGHAPRAGRAWPLVVTSAWRGRALSRASV